MVVCHTFHEGGAGKSRFKFCPARDLNLGCQCSSRTLSPLHHSSREYICIRLKYLVATSDVPSIRCYCSRLLPSSDMPSNFLCCHSFPTPEKKSGKLPPKDFCDNICTFYVTEPDGLFSPSFTDHCVVGFHSITYCAFI